MEVREAAMADAPEVLAFVRAKAQFDRELGTCAGNLGTTEELIRRHLFGPRPFAFAILAGGPARPSDSPCIISATRPSAVARACGWTTSTFTCPRAGRGPAGC